MIILNGSVVSEAAGISSYVNDILWEIMSKPLNEVSYDIDISQEELENFIGIDEKILYKGKPDKKSYIYKIF